MIIKFLVFPYNMIIILCSVKHYRTNGKERGRSLTLLYLVLSGIYGLIYTNLQYTRRKQQRTTNTSDYELVTYQNVHSTINVFPLYLPDLYSKFYILISKVPKTILKVTIINNDYWCRIVHRHCTVIETYIGSIILTIISMYHKPI